MIRLFVAPGQIDLDARVARIQGQDHLHLARVMRAVIGQDLILLDGLGAAFRVTLVAIDKHESMAEVVERLHPQPEPCPHITIGQALAKSDKFEQVIQHGTEAGAGAFIPIEAERSVATIRTDRISERAERWRAIAKGAAEQSCRARVPVVGPPGRLKDVLNAAAESGAHTLFMHTGSRAMPLFDALQRIPAMPNQLFVFIGPEGGWSANELELAAAAECALVSLGPRVLRTETAALVAISQLLYHYSRPLEIQSCVS